MMIKRKVIDKVDFFVILRYIFYVKKAYLYYTLFFIFSITLIFGFKLFASEKTKTSSPEFLANQNFIFSDISYSMKNIFGSNTTDLDFLKSEPELLWIFKNSYPNISFQSTFDFEQKDWKIEISQNDKSITLYWANGKFLPQKELYRKDLYSSFLYSYPKEVPDPKDFTEEDIKHIKEYTSTDNRSESLGTAQFLYNFIYDVENRVKTESHIKGHSFLKKRTNAHQYIHGKLDLVQADIYEAAKSDAEVQSFLDKLDSADSYAWRSISDSGNRSFHSMGLAIDVLPKGWGQKNLYWAWRRDIDPQNWMLLDLDRRWMPPAKVIEIFEKHGFIWGGKWIIWDNMHFEYRPEVILYNNLGFVD